MWYELPVIYFRKMFQAGVRAVRLELANWIPLRRAWTTITSVALGAVQFLARSRNMSGGPYGGGSSLATVRAPALRARATRPPSRNIIARRRAQSCSPRFDRRGRTLGVARHTLARAYSRPPSPVDVAFAREVLLDPSRVRFPDTPTLTPPRLPIPSLVSTVHARGRRGGRSWLRGGDGHLHRSGAFASRAVRASSPARALRSSSPRDRPSRVVTPRLKIGFLFRQRPPPRDPNLTPPPSPFRHLAVQEVSLRRTHSSRAFGDGPEMCIRH